MRWSLGFLFLLLFFLVAHPAEAALLDRVNEAYQVVHGHDPSASEWTYWAGRVQNKEKTTFEALVGAMAWQNINSRNTPVSAPASLPAAGSFKTADSLYPSPYGPNLLSDGTLIRSTAGATVYYVRGGKRSYVLPGVLDKWLKEAHFFNSSVVIVLSPQDFARYQPTSSRNPLYIGKVLQAPNGTQYYIDDKLRKRQLSAGVRSKLKLPAGNLYATSSAQLSEFPTGPALDGKLQPGGMIIYDGPYHGGRIWRLEEAAGGKIMKRLYLGDRFYEAEYYPDESQRVGVAASELARYGRGANIATYPDGWVVGLGNNVFLVQGGKLRLITSPTLLAAMGYKSGNVQKAFPEFLKQLGRGQNVGAFKTAVTGNATTKGGPAPVPSVAATAGLTRVRPATRALIGEINPIYRSVYDKEVTPAENRFWADYIFSGEVSAKSDLIDKMRQAKASGSKPGKTCQTCAIDENVLKDKWFPYLFYYTWQTEPSGEDTAFWRGRIESGRNTIQKLDSNIQWLKQSKNKTRD